MAAGEGQLANDLSSLRSIYTGQSAAVAKLIVAQLLKAAGKRIDSRDRHS